ncbi:MAG TPA: hypothetical protein VNC22_06290 [Sporichthya sp.]|jgi:hypothetical protein|nr:hypothetical protein [Sporichthya sp.]
MAALSPPGVRCLRWPACLLVVLVALGGCVSPALGEDSYRGKGQQAAGAALSEVATAQLVLEQVLKDNLPRPYADETVSAAEDALGSISDSFGAVQPPRESDNVQSDVSDLLDEAAAAVTEARIAVRRGDDDAMRNLVEELHDLADQLRRLEDSLA